MTRLLDEPVPNFKTETDIRFGALFEHRKEAQKFIFDLTAAIDELLERPDFQGVEIEFSESRTLMAEDVEDEPQ